MRLKQWRDSDVKCIVSRNVGGRSERRVLWRRHHGQRSLRAIWDMLIVGHGGRWWYMARCHRWTAPALLPSRGRSVPCAWRWTWRRRWYCRLKLRWRVSWRRRREVHGMGLGGRRPRNVLLPLTIHPVEHTGLFEKHVAHCRIGDQGDQQTAVGERCLSVLVSSMIHITVTTIASAVGKLPSNSEAGGHRCDIGVIQVANGRFDMVSFRFPRGCSQDCKPELTSQWRRRRRKRKRRVSVLDRIMVNSCERPSLGLFQRVRQPGGKKMSGRSPSPTKPGASQSDGRRRFQPQAPCFEDLLPSHSSQ